jgi:hypothetical protein
MSAAGRTSRGRIRSSARRTARGKAPKVRLTRVFRSRRRLDVRPKATIRHDVYLRARDVVVDSGVSPYLDRRLHEHRGE